MLNICLSSFVLGEANVTCLKFEFGRFNASNISSKTLLDPGDYLIKNARPAFFLKSSSETALHITCNSISNV